MQTGEPSESGGQASPDSAETAGGAQGADDQTEALTAQPAPDPILKGEPLTLWATLLTPLVVFLVVIMLIIRGSARAARRRAAANMPPDFFQPAGEGAEISFEDEETDRPQAAPGKNKKSRRADNRDSADNPETRDAARSEPDHAKVASALPEENDDTRETELEKQETSLRAEAPATAPARHEGGLASFFGKGRKKRSAPETNVEQDEQPHHDIAEAPAEDSKAGQGSGAWARLEDGEDAFSRHAGDTPHYGEDEAAIARRQVEEEFRRIEDERRVAQDREADFERRKQMAALDEQRRALEEHDRSLVEQAEAIERQFDALRRDLANELDARFEAIATRVDERLAHSSATPASTGASEEQLSAIAEFISRRIGEERSSFDGVVASLSNQIDSLTARIDGSRDLRQEVAALKRSVNHLNTGMQAGRSAEPSDASTPLPEVIRAVLPPKNYEIRALLSNGRRADGLVRLPHMTGSIAIDAQFPTDAFLSLPPPGGSESLRAENEFRRSALRHIADVAEHLILPGETADSALLYIPSERLYTQLHARFPDIVQDSNRARVWIVSPTTIMATLHAMRAVLRNVSARIDPAHENDSEILSELTELRNRVASLKGRFEDSGAEEAKLAGDEAEEGNRLQAEIRTEDNLASPDHLAELTDRLEPEENTHDDPDIGPMSEQSADGEETPPAQKSERRDSSEGDLWEEEPASPKTNAPFPLR